MAFDTPPPAFPSTADRTNFDPRGDAALAWLYQFGLDFTTTWPTLLSILSIGSSISGLSTAFDTSATSNSITDAADRTFTVSAGKGFLPGMYVRVARTSAPVTTWMSGFVKTYSSTTLVITMDYKAAGATGTFTDWTITPASINSLPPASAAQLLLGSSNSLSLTPAVYAAASAFYTLTDAATIATNAQNGVNFAVTLGGNRTMGAPTNLIDGWYYTWLLIQDGTGSRTVSWNATFLWPGAGAPLLSVAPGAIDIASGQYRAATGKLHMGFQSS